MSPGLIRPDDRRGAALRVGAERLLLVRGQPAVGVAGGEAAVAEGRVVARRLLDAGDDLARRARASRRGPAMCCSQPISSPVSSKMHAAPCGDQQVEGAADRRVGGDAAGAVGAAADRADHQLGRRPSAPVPASRARQRSPRPRPRRARSVLRVPPVSWITSVATGRPRGRDRLLEAAAVEALAAERHEQHRADVRMRAEPLHHPVGVGVRVAAGEADQVHVAARGSGATISRATWWAHSTR